MISFKILKKSRRSRARLGILKTAQGEVETPTLVAVGTQAVVKTLTSEEIKDTKTQIIISNTFHLHLKPGENYVKESGGIHKFANLNLPVMTDSGGFQVFSLGFGKDLGVGKTLKPDRENDEVVKVGSKPSEIRITEFGVYFRSPLDGSKLFIGPRESIKIQESLGGDIMFAFDECTPPLSTHEYAKKALLRTHKWEKICFESRKTSQSLFGIIQGSKFKDLREESARFINSLDFDGFGIGGDLGESKKGSKDILSWTIPNLAENKPRHLLGIGHLDDMAGIIEGGVDLFDCTTPTQYARRGVAFVGEGELDLKKQSFLKEKEPLEPKCDCFVCQNYKRNYISHLIRAREITGLKLLTFHNLYFFNTFVESLRSRIKQGKL